MPYKNKLKYYNTKISNFGFSVSLISSICYNHFTYEYICQNDLEGVNADRKTGRVIKKRRGWKGRHHGIKRY